MFIMYSPICTVLHFTVFYDIIVILLKLTSVISLDMNRNKIKKLSDTKVFFIF